MLRIISLSLLLIFIGVRADAQKSPVKFGQIDINNLKMTHSSIDSTAGAMVITDFGYISYDHNFEILLTHHVRMKIFNSSEFDRADIKIPFSSRDRVDKLKAATYNLENGKVVTTKVEKSDIFEESVNDNVDQKRFSFPNVKEGSIIEYSYKVNYGNWGSLSPWYFQSSIPVLHSEYTVALPDYFNYKKVSKGYVPITQERKNQTGNHNGGTFNVNVQRFIAKNIPAFEEEPYLACKNDHISNIRFELSTLIIPGQIHKTYMPPSYKAMSKSIAESDWFGKKLERGRFLREDVQTITADKETDEQKVKAIYDFVRDNFEVDYSVKSENLKKIYDLKKGYPLDINMILIAMLKEGGFDASGLKLSTTSHGKLNPFYSMSSNFNKTVCTVKIGEEDYLLDASNKNLPFNTLPESYNNGEGMVISADNFRWVDLTPKNISKKVISANLELDEEGYVTGKIDVSRGGYAAIDFRSNHKKDLAEYKKNFSERKTTWEIMDHSVENLENVEVALKEKIELEIEEYAESAGDIIYLTPIAYGRIDENPFKTAERLYPVSYGVPFNNTMSFRIKIPEGYEVDEKPEPMAIGLPNKAGSFFYNIQAMGDVLSVTARLMINKSEFLSEEYQYLREFYAQMIAKQAEQVVLKRVN